MGDGMTVGELKHVSDERFVEIAGHAASIAGIDFDWLTGQLLLAEAADRIDRLRAEVDGTKTFPIQSERGAKPHPLRIPWSVAELAYSVYASRYGRGQSLERLAERGGFGPGEMDEFVPDWRERCDENARLRAEVERMEAAQAEADAKFAAMESQCAGMRDALEQIDKWVIGKFPEGESCKDCDGGDGITPPYVCPSCYARSEWIPKALSGDAGKKLTQAAHVSEKRKQLLLRIARERNGLRRIVEALKAALARKRPTDAQMMYSGQTQFMEGARLVCDYLLKEIEAAQAAEAELREKKRKAGGA